MNQPQENGLTLSELISEHDRQNPKRCCNSVEHLISQNAILVGPCEFCGKSFNTYLQYTHCSLECAELSELEAA